MISRRPIRHAFFRSAAGKFWQLITDDKFWPAFVARFPELAQLVEHEKRATRRDLRMGIASVVWHSLSRCDKKSLRVGWRHRHQGADGRMHDFVGLPRDVVARWTRLSESTVSRAWTLLRRSSIMAGPSLDGFNHIAQPREDCAVSDATPNGVRGLPAIRRFFEHFFERLGLGRWLGLLRNPPAPSSPAPLEPARAVADRNVKAVGDLVDELARALGPPDDPG